MERETFRGTSNDSARSRVQWNRAIPLDESHKSNPRPLDESPRPKSVKLRLNLHGTIWEGKSIFGIQSICPIGCKFNAPRFRQITLKCFFLSFFLSTKPFENYFLLNINHTYDIIFLMPKSINTGKNQGIPLIGESSLKNVIAPLERWLNSFYVGNSLGLVSYMI